MEIQKTKRKKKNTQNIEKKNTKKHRTQTVVAQ